MWVDCLTFSGRSLRLVAVGGFYAFVPSVLSGISLNLSMYRNTLGFYTVFPSVAVRGGCGFGCSANVAIICLGNIITQRLNNSKCKIALFFKHFQIPQSLYYRAFSTFSQSQKTTDLQINRNETIVRRGGTIFPAHPPKKPSHHRYFPPSSQIRPRSPKTKINTPQFFDFYRRNDLESLKTPSNNI